MDLHAVYAQPREFGFVVVDPLTFSPPALSFAGGTWTLPSVTIIPGTILEVTAGQQTLSIGGSNIAVNPLGEAIGGQVTVYGQCLDGQAQFLLAGLNASANSVSLATSNVATDDDALLFYTMMGRNDFVTLSAGNDRINTSEGTDLVVDQGGADTVLGSHGDDVIMTGKGSDWVDAGSDNDIVVGGAGDDRLLGSTGQDVLWAGIGSDRVTGGRRRDAFVFKAGVGTATIVDFNAADDQILFIGGSAGLANLHMRQNGADLVITFPLSRSLC